MQVIKDAKSSEKADVYAFGILLWELATREQVGTTYRMRVARDEATQESNMVSMSMLMSMSMSSIKATTLPRVRRKCFTQVTSIKAHA